MRTDYLRLPTYPSGHSTFGGALFEVLRTFYGRDDIAFSFMSDEFNGVTKGRDGQRASRRGDAGFGLLALGSGLVKASSLETNA